MMLDKMPKDEAVSACRSHGRGVFQVTLTEDYNYLRNIAVDKWTQRELTIAYDKGKCLQLLLITSKTEHRQYHLSTWIKILLGFLLDESV